MSSEGTKPYMYMYSHQEYSDRYLQVANLTGSMELSILRLCRMALDGLHNLQERVEPSVVAPSSPPRTITRVIPTL